ncbi:MAG: hypothetical protein IPM42_19355 [Saprospiraceae bacterium]|nr:hypothetical protein [Saprospiraceae bacterium]
MKTFNFGMICLFIVMIFFSCSNSESSGDNINPTDIQNSLISKQWIVKYYYDRDKEKTSDFSGYVFEFRSDKVVKAIKASQVINGIWNLRNDSGKTKMDLAFSGNDKFEEISEDWEVVKKTETIIELKHISGGDGHQDLLTFEIK